VIIGFIRAAQIEKYMINKLRIRKVKQEKALGLIILFIGLFLLQYSCTVNDSGVETIQKNPIQQKLMLESAELYMTAQNTEYRLSKMNELQFEDFKQPEEHYPTIMLNAKITFQNIEGFGGAITDAAAETFYKLSKDKQKEILQAYFNREKGIGYSLCRTHINSCDFSSESYAYSEVEGDADLNHFTIQHDRKYRIPLMLASISATDGSLKFFASPWSPPAWMKTNNNMLQGGKLKPEYYQTWANYFVKFIQEYQKEGLPIWGVTVQNEPMATQTWESCLYSAEDERDFVKKYLGPAFEKASLEGVKIIIWDHNRGPMVHRAEIMYSDPEASKYVWGTGFHWYTGDHFENVKLHNEAYPEKKLLFTEGCVFPFEYNKLADWNWGEHYGESILHDLNNSAVGWVDWNILLDETGGPNHVANFCYAPVIGNTKTDELVYMNSYYYMGHFSKFIRPGAYRILCSSNNDDLLATSMLNPDGEIVTVIMNASDNAIELKIWIENRGLKIKSPAHSILTVVFN
jgi:glucosylceramidase